MTQSASIGITGTSQHGAPIHLRHLTMGDLAQALKRGGEDWLACHTAIPVLALLAPVGGILLAALAAAPSLTPLWPVSILEIISWRRPARAASWV